MLGVFSFYSALPEIILFFSGLLILGASLFIDHEKRCFFVFRALFLSLLFAFVALLYVGFQEGTAFYGHFMTNPLIGSIKIFFLIFAAIFLFFSGLREDTDSIFRKRPEYLLLYLFSILGGMLLLSSTGLMGLYVFLELQSLPLYVLALMDVHSLKNAEAGMKFFILGAVASAFVLFGISLIYGFSGGLLEYSAIQLYVSQGVFSRYLLMGVIFLFIGLAFKMSAVPFHFWTPDVYEGVHLFIVSILSVLSKLVSFVIAFFLLYRFFSAYEHFLRFFFEILSILSLILGAFAGLVQQNIQRLLAYSSITQAGYILMLFTVMPLSGTSVFPIFLLTYMIPLTGLYVTLLSCRSDGKLLSNIEDFAELSKGSPLLGVSLLVFLFSMIGIPPMFGFFGKFFVFKEVLISGKYFLFFVGLLASFVSAVYYLRLVYVIYFKKKKQSFSMNLDSVSFSAKSLIFMLVIISIAGSFMIDLILRYTSHWTSIASLY